MQHGRHLEGELELGEQRCCLSRSCERGATSKAKDMGAAELLGPPKPSPRQGSSPRPAPYGTAPWGWGRATSTRWAGPRARAPVRPARGPTPTHPPDEKHSVPRSPPPRSAIWTWRGGIESVVPDTRP
ncbi:hypothetical protein NN561_009746 [Cricetulus griseus]